MSTSETSRYVRLRVELVLEVADAERLSAAALDRVAADETLPDDERAHARAAVRDDGAEALAYLVEPLDLVKEVPGIDLAQASWTSELIDYDPDAVEWDLDDDGDDEDGDGDGGDETGIDGSAQVTAVADGGGVGAGRG
ncbi:MULTISPECIES: hypothetical protein [unclassified Streptomyces]|uniref:hypothetical protein n=1 Tax=unclassified Streptomyces TaxID=2593676 RepID=UPI002E2ACAE9|nr:hypothetical protein [Streptomyces sp. NBC_01429]